MEWVTLLGGDLGTKGSGKLFTRSTTTDLTVVNYTVE